MILEETSTQAEAMVSTTSGTSALKMERVQVIASQASQSVTVQCPLQAPMLGTSFTMENSTVTSLIPEQDGLPVTELTL